jgi:DNA repair and recombination protein RAD52
MTFTPDQTAALTAPLNSANVLKNPKGFDYIEGWRAIDEANRIFGFAGWDREIVTLEQVGPSYEVNGNHRVAYRATVRVRVYAVDRIIVRDGTGYGSGIVKDLNDAHEGAVKEAETDAMKRAFMTFGNPFGLALYDKSRANVADVAPEPSPELRGLIAAMHDHQTPDALRKWLDASGKPLRAKLPDAEREHFNAAYTAFKAGLGAVATLNS